MNETTTSPYRQIYVVFIALVVLTILEFIVAAYLPSVVFLTLIALAKAGLIVHFFMHIYRLWNNEESH
ncbi:MAG: cytochrome C oxidase subunit IV family protein [Candidatus Promineifilaceae bacterium]|nr:cytochrome C oxidase subunit IV family protein [Candidatus Promineifilaceae bacterium]